MSAAPYGARIFAQHAALLQASAISVEVARERDYVTVDVKARLASIGIIASRQAVPGLLIPLRRADGSVWGFQYRPDEPAAPKGAKPRKYETPRGQRNGIDIPPGVKDKIGDPTVPLFITEGSRKADSAVSAGLCCISLSGVWNWVGKNAYSGTTALADWRDIALKGRRTVIAFDSDCVVKPGVLHAMRELGRYLEGKDAAVEYLHLPHGEDGKTGLDDFIAEHGASAVMELVRPDPRPDPPALREEDDGASIIPPAVVEHPSTPPPWAADLDILARLVADASRGAQFVGERRSAKLVYLALQSRRLDDPVSLAIKGLSSSGKSYTVETVLRFVPEETVITMTAMSERALVYMKEDFAHRTLVLFEAVALREEREKAESNMTAYIVRSLLSEGQIRYPVVMKGGDGFETVWIKKDGPTNMIVTTTSVTLHGENETRMISLPTDDSQKQTAGVMDSIAAGAEAAEKITFDFSEWHEFDKRLDKANHDVVIPYARWLAAQIPPVAVRLRRDFRAVLRLIQTHAMLHQLSRETRGGQIIATEADYLAVRALVVDLITDAIQAGVRETVRETVAAVAMLDNGNGVTVTRLCGHLKLERQSVQHRVQAARDKGYIINLEDKRGKPGRYATGDPLPEDRIILPERVLIEHPTPPAATPDGETAGDGGCSGAHPLRRGIKTATA